MLYAKERKNDAKKRRGRNRRMRVKQGRQRKMMMMTETEREKSERMTKKTIQPREVKKKPEGRERINSG
jgi:hypothetical protein